MSHTAERLSSYIDSNIAFLDELLEIASEEKQAMKKTDPELVQAAAIKKVAVLKEMLALDHERLALQENNSSLLELAQQNSLSSKWASLVEKLKQFDKENTLCGMLINAHKYNTNNLLNLIKGQHESTQNYDKTGQLQQNNTSTRHGKA